MDWKDAKTEEPTKNGEYLFGWVGKASGWEYYDIVFFNKDRHDWRTSDDKCYNLELQNYKWMELPRLPEQDRYKGYLTQCEMIQNNLNKET